MSAFDVLAMVMPINVVCVAFATVTNVEAEFPPTFFATYDVN
jgi:hypothetical protein